MNNKLGRLSRKNNVQVEGKRLQSDGCEGMAPKGEGVGVEYGTVFGGWQHIQIVDTFSEHFPSIFQPFCEHFLGGFSLGECRLRQILAFVKSTRATHQGNCNRMWQEQHHQLQVAACICFTVHLPQPLAPPCPQQQTKVISILKCGGSTCTDFYSLVNNSAATLHGAGCRVAACLVFAACSCTTCTT